MVSTTAPLRRLKLYLQIKHCWYFKLVSPFLNAFLHLRFSEKGTLSEGFAFSEGPSGLMAASAWFIVRWGGGGVAEAGVDPNDKDLQILDL